jgi:hypothetical protein
MWRSRSWALKAAIHSASSASTVGVAVMSFLPEQFREVGYHARPRGSTTNA